MALAEQENTNRNTDSDTDQIANNNMTLVVGMPGSGKTSLSLFIAQQQIGKLSDKIVLVQSDSLPFKAGRFGGETGLSLDIANRLYLKHTTRFDHMMASDALVTVQMSRLLPDAITSRRTYILDEVDSEPLLEEFLDTSQESPVIMCFQGFESIPVSLTASILGRADSIYIASTPANYAMDYSVGLSNHTDLFGTDSKKVCEILSTIHQNEDMHSEFAVCQRNSPYPVLYRQWIDGDVDILTEKGQCRMAHSEYSL